MVGTGTFKKIGTGRYESKTFSRSYNKMFSPAKKDGSATHGIILSNFYP